MLKKNWGTIKQLNFFKFMVPLVGLEPTHLAVPDFESGASTISPQGPRQAAFGLASGSQNIQSFGL